MRRRLAFALALAALLVLGAAVASSAADDRPGGKPPAKMRFVQRAEAGTLRWQGGKLVLRLRGVPTTSAWVERRRGGERRRIHNQRLIERIIGHPRLVSAAARLRAERDGEVSVVPLRLLDGDWDARRGRAVYRAEPGRKRADLPRRFGPAILIGEVDPTHQAPPAGCVGVECAARNIAELIEWTYNFFTSRHTCTGAVANFSGEKLVWKGDEKKSQDSWQANPARELHPQSGLPDVDTFRGWTTVSAWLRGCWNNVTYENSYGTVRVETADPYSGSNTWYCRVTGELGCLGPDFTIHGRPGWPGFLSELGGNHLAVAVCVYRKPSARPCDDDPWE